ncbi:sushi domain-containing protein 2 isoform X2 [Paroedura picta]|uniref:sushi domain-containing protein 2 isoform X2 n=1 Tax=Paroedura picta TaxID=143630 RepID=UPI004056D5F3
MNIACFNVIFIIFCNNFLLETGAQHSCSNRCGESPTNCSCQATCKSLGICCPDYWQFCLHISPYSGTLLGGKDLTILNVTFETSADVKCRFGQEIVTSGYVAADGHAHCISPLLYQTGMVSLEVSSDGGQTFPRSSMWFSDHHSKVASSEKSTLMNETKWQYYGTPGTGGRLTVTWNNQTLQASHVNIELWGYQETGEPYSENWAAEWKYLYTLTKNFPNTGTFSFLPAPSALHSAWELGVLRITSSGCLEGQSNVAAIWSSEHALAWHLEDAFREDSAAWATAKCHAWDVQEAGLPGFLAEILDCPCTLAQARADTGRFHTDYGCDMEKGSVCTYHPGAVHCVRSIQASPSYAAGQQCCYDATGVQVLTGDSVGGSTPDRGHDWGSPPYKKPPRIPGFSHWMYDVLSFYYCCLWSDNCSYYFKHRPSSGCRQYHPPRAASAFGDPHFITFDGTHFTFNGLGEYTLLESDLTSLRVQGRTRQTSQNGSEAKVTGFSAIAMQENNSDVVEMRIPEYSLSTLEVLLNHHALNFSEQMWMDPKGAISNTTSLLTYDTQYLLHKFFYGPKHDTAFVPVFSPPEDPTDTQAKDMASICQLDPFCRFDILTTRDLAVGNNTKWSHQNYKHLKEDLQPVASCAWLPFPLNGSKNSTNYLVGSVIHFQCSSGYTFSGSTERTCLSNGEWSGEPATCLPSTGAKQQPALVTILGILGFGILAILIV